MPRNDDLVSIIMPAYNCQKYVVEAIDCIITQSNKKLKQFLVYGLIEPLICAACRRNGYFYGNSKRTITTDYQRKRH
jgi:hypothetical protein